MSSKIKAKIKKEDTYEALLKKGMIKAKAAKIANAQAAGSIDYNAEKLENRTKKELLDQAKQLGIKGRYQKNKTELINSIRNG